MDAGTGRPGMTSTQSRSDFSGVWELNFEKSSLRGPAPERILMKIDHKEPRLVQEIFVTIAGGKEQRMTFNLEIGAETTNPMGGATARNHAWWQEQELVIESKVSLSGREAYFKDHWSLSEDGQTLTMEHRDDDLAGQIAVLEKRSSTRTAEL
jgi:hypothetical protein